MAVPPAAPASRLEYKPAFASHMLYECHLGYAVFELAPTLPAALGEQPPSLGDVSFTRAGTWLALVEALPFETAAIAQQECVHVAEGTVRGYRGIGVILFVVSYMYSWSLILSGCCFHDV
jgi:hypothetical protein